MTLFLGCAEVGAGRFQGCNHLFRRNQAGIVGYGVDLFETFESDGNFFHARQPLQGCFADRVSPHVKHGFSHGRAFDRHGEAPKRTA